ncbi:hypothetical protein [Dermatophilus congolensis]|uniref:hypothetical protein n=1 Tax=Dermatophilus congolensis TaxID=1863 RepID=UPI001AAEE659|nr:hypothetical protein [Dermatophilus congolensis]MBO3146193.1 hypothetical protein [Dermatophilus congolensis]MBO3148761.1 hypothetical protein [Dermatophilus congolensis]MBO3166448.1 hypothetical protein [Dermatophilus congolensis]MBO3209284.1 hypothetical protein [Dermatophilus congolensis]
MDFLTVGLYVWFGTQEQLMGIMFFLVGLMSWSEKETVGNPAGISGEIPDAADIKSYRAEHPGATITDAIRALQACQ